MSVVSCSLFVVSRGEAFGELFLAMTDNLSSKCFARTVVRCSLSVVSCQLSVVSCQLSVVSGKTITNYQLPITNYQLPITNYQLPNY
ncbi:hypothetical protein FJR01_03105 [Dolichospermum sp. UHCC 0299]|nr:hypothetical protein [Dolichospermum sp. UHCC 0299]